MSLKRLSASLILAFYVALGPASASPGGWVLALTWHPGFCARASQPQECGMVANVLVFHGLWRDGRGNRCVAADHLLELDRQRQWCRLPAPSLAAKNAQALDAVMPGRASCLDRHEWLKHGVCSGLNADSYFSHGAALTAAARTLEIARMLTARAGETIMLADIRSAAARDFGDANINAVAAVCRVEGGVARLSEIRIFLRQDGLDSFPARTAVRSPERPHQNCPGKRPIHIDGRRP